MSVNCEKTSLRTVVIDLTPMLPGGTNGGAKGFVQELVRELSAMASQTQFVLLTQAAAHEELATLERPNVRRVLTVGQGSALPSTSLPARIFFGILPHLPVRIAAVVARTGSRLLSALK